MQHERAFGGSHELPDFRPGLWIAREKSPFGIVRLAEIPRDYEIKSVG